MRESGETLPKPLVEVGGRPILWHVMSLYASQGGSDQPTSRRAITALP
jgi:glucose-1-phosphate cytidylyltransferase